MRRIFVERLNLFGALPPIARGTACLILLLLTLTASVCCMSYQLGNSADKPNSYKYHIGEAINYAVQIGNPSDSGENFTVDIYDILPNSTRVLLGRNVSLSPGEEKIYSASYIVRAEDGRIYPRFGAAVNNSVSMEITTEAGTKVNASSNAYSHVDSSAATNSSATISENESSIVTEISASQSNGSQKINAEGHEENVTLSSAERGDVR